MKNKAFTLIETLIAITLTTVVITAVTGLILSTLLSSQRNIHTLQGLYLAQEGLEAVRFMRDSNWLQNYSWDDAAPIWGSDFATDTTFYLKEERCSPPTVVCFSLSNTEEDGLVEMDDGFEFTRTIEFSTITDENDETVDRENTLEVKATVYWTDRIIERSVTLSTYLTNWQ